MSRSRKRTRGRPTETPPGTTRPALDAAETTVSREALVSILVIAAGTILAYSNTFGASFHFDDEQNIVKNPAIRDLFALSPLSTRYLGFLSFALNYRLGGVAVLGYHLRNVLIHVCNGLLVFWLAALTLRTPVLRRADTGRLVRRFLPLAAGLLFAVHPVQTEAVTYVVQRFASMATLFFISSIALYVKARMEIEQEPRSNGRVAVLYALSVVSAVAAMKTKEISFTLPLVAAGYELLFFTPRSRRSLLLLAPLAATALLVPLGLATQGRSFGDVLEDARRVVADAPGIPRSVYFLTQPRVVVRYLRLLVLPTGQNLDYDFTLCGDVTGFSSPDVPVAILLGSMAQLARLSHFGELPSARCVARRARPRARPDDDREDRTSAVAAGAPEGGAPMRSLTMRGKASLLLGVASAAIAAVNGLDLPLTARRLKRLAGGEPLLDLRVRYGPEEAHRLLSRLGALGRSSYLTMLWTVDLLLPALFGLSLWVTIGAGSLARWRRLALAAAAADNLENIAISGTVAQRNEWLSNASALVAEAFPGET